MTDRKPDIPDINKIPTEQKREKEYARMPESIKRVIKPPRAPEYVAIETTVDSRESERDSSGGISETVLAKLEEWRKRRESGDLAELQQAPWKCKCDYCGRPTTLSQLVSVADPTDSRGFKMVCKDCYEKLSHRKARIRDER